MNRREPVPELVRDAGGQLAEARQRFLEPQLLLELDDAGEIGKEADRAARVAGALERRHRHAEMHSLHRPLHFDRPPHDWLAGRQTLGHDVGERRGAGKHVDIRVADVLGRKRQQTAPGGIEHFDASRAIDDHQTRGEAVGDLAAQQVGRLRARARRLLLRLELADGLLQRRRQDRGVGASAAQCALRIARAGKHTQQRERHHRDEHGDERGEADERVAEPRHDASPTQVRYARMAWP